VRASVDELCLARLDARLVVVPVLVLAGACGGSAQQMTQSFALSLAADDQELPSVGMHPDPCQRSHRRFTPRQRQRPPHRAHSGWRKGCSRGMAREPL